MKNLNIASAAAVVLMLSACGGSSTGGGTSSGFAQLGNDGTIAVSTNGNGSTSTRAVRLNGSYGFAYAMEATSGGVRAQSALIDPGDIGAAPQSGSATYDASFELSEIRADDRTTIQDAEGDLALRVDFAKDTVTGKGDGLRVNADLVPNSNRINGNVTWRGVRGQIRGRVSETAILGAFNGDGGGAAYAGGLTGFAR